MRKRLEKLLAMLVLVFSITILYNAAAAKAATNHTLEEALAWVESVLGQTLNPDGIYPGECVDLILSYYDFLQGNHSGIRGNANQYNSNYVPAGFTRIKGAAPQPGDIVIDDKIGEYGHVWIQGYGNVTYHSNYNWQKKVQKITGYKPQNIWGVIRPTFASSVTKENLSIDMKIDNGSFSKGTFDLYLNGSLKSSGIRSFSEKVDSGTTYEIRNIKAETGYRYTKVLKGSLSGTVSKGGAAVSLGFEVVKADADGWIQTNAGERCYVWFPEGFDTSHPLFVKYSIGPLSDSWTADHKVVVVSEEIIGYIYYHWTFNDQYLSSKNYNCWVSTVKGWDAELNRDFKFFAAFESAGEYGHTDKNNRHDDAVFYIWSDELEASRAGSWWWFRIPIYKQSYVEYTRISSDISTATVEIAPATYAGGRAVEPSVKVTYDGKTLTRNTDYYLYYYDNVNAGDGANILIKGNGNYTGSITRNYTIGRAQLPTASIEQKSFDYDGTAKEPAVYVQELVAGKDFSTVYADNINSGTASVTVTGIGNYKGTQTLTFSITKPSLGDFTLSEYEYVYDGEPAEPDVITDKVEGVDFVTSYFNNVEVGTATVRIAGVGKYSDVVEKTFKIVPAVIDEVELSKTKYTYNGNLRKPTVDGENLVKTRDYTITYKNNKNVGIATAVITFKGNYTGTIEAEFEIVPKKAGIKSLSEGDGKLTVKMKKGASGYAADGFQIYYKVKNTSKWQSEKTDKTALTLDKLKADKRYSVKVRTYKEVNGHTLYGPWSSVKTSDPIE